MSIINQTLRELDARKRDAPPPGIPLRPVAAALQRKPGRWAIAAALLSVAGLLAWALSGPDDARTPADSVQRAAAPQIPASRTPPAKPVAASVPAPAPTQPQTLADASPAKPTDSTPPLQENVAAVAEKPPLIRKEIKQPTAEEDAEERYRKALTLVQKGRENQARPLLEEALKLAPGHVAARQMLATLLSEAGENLEAETVLREGRAAAPDNAWFALGLARLQAVRGDTAGAAASLLSGIEGRGVNAEYRATLAALLVRLERYPEATRQYQQALKLQPDQGPWWMGLGLSLDAQGKTGEARSAYGRALAAGDLTEKLAAFVRAKLAE